MVYHTVRATPKGEVPLRPGLYHLSYGLSWSREIHARLTTAHPGERKTHTLLRGQYYWPSTRLDVERVPPQLSTLPQREALQRQGPGSPTAVADTAPSVGNISRLISPPSPPTVVAMITSSSPSAG